MRFKQLPIRSKDLHINNVDWDGLSQQKWDFDYDDHSTIKGCETNVYRAYKQPEVRDAKKKSIQNGNSTGTKMVKSNRCVGTQSKKHGTSQLPSAVVMQCVLCWWDLEFWFACELGSATIVMMWCIWCKWCKWCIWCLWNKWYNDILLFSWGLSPTMSGLWFQSF